MKTLRLRKDRFDAFFSVLQQFGEVHGPVDRDGGFAFQPLARWSDARLDYDRTILPPKKYFLPQRETLFRFDPAGGYRTWSEGLDRKLVLFGVHACDIHGLNVLDLVFNGDYPDPYYQARRRNTAIVGIDCTPDEHCTCHAMRGDFVDRGFDLFLYDVGESWLVPVGTPLGDDMVLAGGGLFEAVTDPDVAEYRRRSTAKSEAFRLDVDIRDLPELFDLGYDDAMWEEFGARCLSCGACSMVCPTCYCFDVQDTAEPGSDACARCRIWDSCLFSSHAAVAGGENFRDSRTDRVKFRFYHKLRGFVAEYGRSSCVGCGRCIVSCPVGNHVARVLTELRGCAVPRAETLGGGWRPAPAWDANPYQPITARIVRIFRMVPDHHLFTLRFEDDAIAAGFRHRPGQFVMLSVPGAGEAPISISSSPTRPGAIELCVRRTGRVTDALYRLRMNDRVGVRGPYGNGYPVDEMGGNDLLVVAGGLGMAPLRSLLGYALDEREKFGRLVLMYGSREPAAMLFREELVALTGRDDMECLLTVDRDPTGAWAHHVGMLPALFDHVEIDPATTYAAVCGPPVVYRHVLERLLALGFSKGRILMSLERRMKCGVGKCGHCSVGYRYTCLHGPIFTYWDAINLPEVI